MFAIVRVRSKYIESTIWPEDRIQFVKHLADDFRDGTRQARRDTRREAQFALLCVRAFN